MIPNSFKQMVKVDSTNAVSEGASHPSYSTVQHALHQSLKQSFDQKRKLLTFKKPKAVKTECVSLQAS